MTLSGEPTCEDVFPLYMPWKNHSACGFKYNVAHSTSTYKIYTANIVVTYSDNVGLVQGVALSRFVIHIHPYMSLSHARVMRTQLSTFFHDFVSHKYNWVHEIYHLFCVDST